MRKLRGMHKVMALALVLTLVVFAAAACGVPDEEEFEEMEEDPIEDDFGMENEISEELVAVGLEMPTANSLV